MMASPLANSRNPLPARLLRAFSQRYAAKLMRYSLVLGLAAGVLQGADYYIQSPSLGHNWSSTHGIWLLNNTGSPVSWINSNPANKAIISASGFSNITLQESISVSAIQQSGFSTANIHSANSTYKLTLSGNGSVISNDSSNELGFASSLGLIFNPTAVTDLLQIQANTGEIRIAGSISGTVGTSSGSTVTGGLQKTGASTLYLSGANTYSGVTRLNAGIVEAGSQTAFGTSKIYFEGGTLRYGAEITQDFSSQFQTGTGVGGFKIDTNGNDVVFNTALVGSGHGLTKEGLGTLTLGSDNKSIGNIEVKAGVLKANAAGKNAFSDSKVNIKVHNGATLDVNASAATGHNWGNPQYIVTIEGKGVEDESKVGGFAGALTNSNTGGLTSTKIFDNIILSGDATISGNRWDISNIDAGFHTLTKVGGDIAWGSGTKKDIGDVIIEQGKLYADSGDFGDQTYTIKISASILPSTGSAVNGTFQNYGVTTIKKQIELNGGEIGATGGTTTLGSFTFDKVSTITLVANAARESNFVIHQNSKDLILKGKVTGNSGFIVSLSNFTTGSNIDRYSAFYLLNSDNDFTGTIKLSRGITRLSDGTDSGTLGNVTNTIQFTAQANGTNLTTTDYNTFLDLYGTQQSIGALNGNQASHHVINNRAGSQATLTVGNGNANGSFAGTLRDYYVTPNAKLTHEGTTGVLNFTKRGTGVQILSNANLYSGATRVEAGTLLLKNTTGSGTGTSSFMTLAGSGARVGGTGSITGGSSKEITLGAGTFLMVGGSHSSSSFDTAAGLDTSAKTFTLGANQKVDISLAGNLQFDLFTKTTSDSLLLLSNGGDLLLNGNIEVALASNANTSTWAIGDKWKLVDWNGFTGGGALTQNLSLRTSTLAGFALQTYVENKALYLQLAVIPEPSRAFLVLGGLLGFAFIRRR